MLEGFDLLGKRVRDKVTRFEGVVTSISYDLYGCVQAVINPGLGKDGKLGEGHWFDVKRLNVLDKRPIMPVPSFEQIPGGERLPSQSAK